MSRSQATGGINITEELTLKEKVTDKILYGRILRHKLAEIKKSAATFQFIRIALSAMDEQARDFFTGLDKTTRALNLPQPLFEFNQDYLEWTRNVQEFARETGWLNDERIKEFVQLKKSFGKELLCKKPRIQILQSQLQEQIVLLESIDRNPPTHRKKKEKQNTLSKEWALRKVALVTIYIAICLVLDAVLFFLIGVLIVGIITIQIAILFGVPKLIEWLKH